MSPNLLENRGVTNTVGSLLSGGLEFLQALGDREARNCTELLLQEVLQTTRSQLYLESERTLSVEQAGRFWSLIERRRKREPLAYLLNEASFWKERLTLSQACLIPRPETEGLVERVLDRIPEGNAVSILDLGCGSGAIGIAIARERPRSSVTFSDISADALEICSINAGRYGLNDRTECVLSDLFSAFHPVRQWNFIVSNPPYVASGDLQRLEPELFFEPEIALDGGKDGMDFYRRIPRESAGYLKAGGILALEVGVGQAATVRKWIAETGVFGPAQTYLDWSGKERVVIAERI